MCNFDTQISYASSIYFKLKEDNLLASICDFFHF